MKTRRNYKKAYQLLINRLLYIIEYKEEVDKAKLLDVCIISESICLLENERIDRRAKLAELLTSQGEHNKATRLLTRILEEEQSAEKLAIAQRNLHEICLADQRTEEAEIHGEKALCYLKSAINNDGIFEAVKESFLKGKQPRYPNVSEIWQVKIPGDIHSPRPCVVINKKGMKMGGYTVLPISSKRGGDSIPIKTMDVDGYCLCESVTTLKQKFFVRYIGFISNSQHKKLLEATALALRNPC